MAGGPAGRLRNLFFIPEESFHRTLLDEKVGRKRSRAPHAFQECRNTTEENPRTGLHAERAFPSKEILANDVKRRANAAGW